jgi:parvulin-like peptidyl-prolyl isomerase
MTSIDRQRVIYYNPVSITASFMKSLRLIALALLLTACQDAPSAPPPAGQLPGSAFQVTINAPTAAPTVTPVPTYTPAPLLAAIVNGEQITLDQFNAELARYLGDADPSSADGQQRSQQLRPIVLDDMIQRILIAQEAITQGVNVTEEQVDAEIAAAKQDAGGDEAYVTWLAQNKMTDIDARVLVRTELQTAALRDRVFATVPQQTEYVRAFHIVVGSEAEAQRVLNQLQSGAKFSALAASQSLDESTRADDGDLGWFARGTGAIIWPEIEEAAFALQPGETSEVVRSPAGFHVIRVTARENRALTDDDRVSLNRAALETWLSDLQSRARIERFLN